MIVAVNLYYEREEKEEKKRVQIRVIYVRLFMYHGISCFPSQRLQWTGEKDRREEEREKKRRRRKKEKNIEKLVSMYQ